MYIHVLKTLVRCFHTAVHASRLESRVFTRTLLEIQIGIYCVALSCIYRYCTLYSTVRITVYIRVHTVWIHIVICILNSGHTVKAACDSFNVSKDAGYKIVMHMMPDLPNVGIERDIEQFLVRVTVNEWKLHSFHIKCSPKILKYFIYCIGLYTCITFWSSRLIALFALHFTIGILGEPGVPRGRLKAVPDAGDPRDGSVRALEDGPLPELCAERAGGPGGAHPGADPGLVPRVPRAARHPDAARLVGRRERQPAWARARPHASARPPLPRRAHARSGHPADPPPRAPLQGVLTVHCSRAIWLLHPY